MRANANQTGHTSLQHKDCSMQGALHVENTQTHTLQSLDGKALQNALAALLST
jgi:hypothetical protein